METRLKSSSVCAVAHIEKKNLDHLREQESSLAQSLETHACQSLPRSQLLLHTDLFLYCWPRSSGALGLRSGGAHTATLGLGRHVHTLYGVIRPVTSDREFPRRCA